MNLLEQLNKEREKRASIVLSKLQSVSLTVPEIEKIGISIKSGQQIKGRFKQGKAGWEAILLFESYFKWRKKKNDSNKQK